MTLLTDIDKAAAELIETTFYTTKNLEYLKEDIPSLSIEQINESAQQFLNTYANIIQRGGELKNKKGEDITDKIINIFAALQALSQEDLAAAFDDRKDRPLGQTLSDLYGKNGVEAHTIAEKRLDAIGRHPSVRSYRAQAEKAVRDSNSIGAFANKIRTKIEPVMNKMLSKERQAAQGRMDKEAAQQKQDNMARPLMGQVARGS
jgi:hypothetical protein